MSQKKRALYKPPPAQDYSGNYCKLIIVIIISFVFISAQFVGGYISGSISVISDAFHLVTDLIGFVISFVFIYYSKQQPTQKISFGYHRMQLIGALGNLFIIYFLALFLIYQATDRIIHKQFVTQPLAMLIVGVGGLVVNIIMFFILHTGGHSHGLMAQQCNHDHNQSQNNDQSQFTTSFCKQMICQDQVCLKQVNQPHCHKKDQTGSPKIHFHEQNRKKSQQIAQNQNQQTLNNLEVKNEKKYHKNKHDENCKHQHNHQQQQSKKQKMKCSHDHKHDHQHEHGHQNKHDHKYQNKNNHSHSNEEHKKCKHDHKNKIQNQHTNEQHDQNHHDHNHEGHHQQHESISMKAAVLHAFSDVIQSIGLLISSLVIFFLGSNMGAPVHEWNDWHYLDPISTYIFSIIVIISTIPILKNCYYLIMESTPSVQKAQQIRKQFQQAKGVIDVHDLHIWDLKPGKTLLIAHVFAKQGAQREVLTTLTEICRHRKIYHSTLQVQQQNWKNHDQYILCDHNIH